MIELPPDLVLLGGPVERDRGFVLHTDDYRCAELERRVGCGRSPDRDAARCWRRSAGHNRRPRRSMLALGYAGWGAGQLEQEIREGAWLTCEPDETLIFGDDHEHKWSMALAKIGIGPHQLSAHTGRA